MSDHDFFDDMMDINHDGKFDSQDMFLNHMIYNEVMNKNEGNKSTYSSNKPSYSSSNNSYKSGDRPSGKPGGGFSKIMIIIAILAVLSMIGKACEKSSSRNYIPRSSHSTYSSPKSSSSYSYHSNKSSSSYSSRSSYSYKSKSSSYNGYKYKSKKSSSKSSDPYNAKDYYDADDLYYDYPDDFWDYEDAEDYYNEHIDD